MIRLLSLTAALALLPLSSALAQDGTPAPESAEVRLETAASAFEARMEAFGERAEAISEDKSLSESVRGQRVAALWAEYAPDVAAFANPLVLDRARGSPPRARGRLHVIP